MYSSQVNADISARRPAQGTYEMREDSLFTVNMMIDYFHSGDYGVAVASELEEDISALQIHARMVSLADRYAIDALVSLSATKYSA